MFNILNLLAMTAMEFNTQLVLLEDNLTRYAVHLTRDYDRAQDLLQDTYLKALTYSSQFGDSTNLKAWTYTIMKNTFINYYRKSMRENTTFDNSKDLFLLSQNKHTAHVSPEVSLSEGEIRMAIDSLSDEFRVPFSMFLEGFKYQEIADALGLKIGTVKSRIFFTRKKLMSSLEGYS